MDQNCLTCHYEPKWCDEPETSIYLRRSGDCKFDFVRSNLPPVYKIIKIKVAHYRDGSGIHKNCPAWAPKRVSSVKENG